MLSIISQSPIDEGVPDEEGSAESSFIPEMIKRLNRWKPIRDRAKSVPGSSRLCPRDCMDLQKTDDLLFLAVLLERSRQTGWIKRLKSKQEWEYLVAAAPESPQTKGTPAYYSTKMLSRMVHKGTEIWKFRRLCESPTPPNLGMTIEGKALHAHGKWTLQKAAAIFSSLKHPLASDQAGNDSRGLVQLRFFEWCDLTTEAPFSLPIADYDGLLSKMPPFKEFKTPAATPAQTAWREQARRRHEKKHLRLLLREQEINPLFRQAICPLCGPCIPLNAGLTSMVGDRMHSFWRSWIYLLCPGCLAVLGSRLEAMS